MTNPERIKYIKQLIDSTKRELANVEAQVWVFNEEAKNPIHIGIEEAEKSRDIYLRQAGHLKARIEAYNLYIKSL